MLSETRTTEVARHYCLRCGREQEFLTSFSGKEPESGKVNFVVCINCANLMVWEHEHNRLRAVTPAEKYRFMTDDECVRVLASTQVLVKERRKKILGF